MLHVAFHREELGGFLLLHLLERNAGHLRDDVHHVVGAHENFLLLPLFAPTVQNPLEFILGLLLLVAERRRLFEILRLDRGFLFHADLLDLALDFLHIRRTRHRVDAGPRAGFVHHVNRLVRQESAGDVAIGKFNRQLERFIGQLGFVMRFVFRAESFQNLNRFIHRGRFHFHGLEAALRAPRPSRCTCDIRSASSRRRTAARRGLTPA